LWSAVTFRPALPFQKSYHVVNLEVSTTAETTGGPLAAEAPPETENAISLYPKYTKFISLISSTKVILISLQRN
jgi:hypothetical protein